MGEASSGVASTWANGGSTGGPELRALSRPIKNAAAAVSKTNGTASNAWRMKEFQGRRAFSEPVTG
jgi:hypothetical protein